MAGRTVQQRGKQATPAFFNSSAHKSNGSVKYADGAGRIDQMAINIPGHVGAPYSTKSRLYN